MRCGLAASAGPWYICGSSAICTRKWRPAVLFWNQAPAASSWLSGMSVCCCRMRRGSPSVPSRAISMRRLRLRFDSRFLPVTSVRATGYCLPRPCTTICSGWAPCSTRYCMARSACLTARKASRGTGVASSVCADRAMRTCGNALAMKASWSSILMLAGRVSRSLVP